MQWDTEMTDGAGVLRLSGFLGEGATHRFKGAFDWVAARCRGVIVVDMSALKGWSAEGEAAILDAADRLRRDGRGPLWVCGIGERPAPLLTSSDLSALQLAPDLGAVLAALGTH